MEKLPPTVMKKTTLTMIAVAISAGILAADYGSLDDYRSKIAIIESAKSQIIEKEKIIESLKARPAAASIWNFIGRSNQEQSVQKRSRIIREISGLKDEAAANTGALLMSREKLAPLLAANVTDKDFMAVLDFMDALKVSELCDYEFVQEAGNSGLKDPQAVDYLRYKAEQQALKIQAMDTHLKYLKVKLQALTEAKLTQAVLVTQAQTDRLKDSRDKAVKSQERLLKAITNYK